MSEKQCPRCASFAVILDYQSKIEYVCEHCGHSFRKPLTKYIVDPNRLHSEECERTEMKGWTHELCNCRCHGEQSRKI